MSKQQEFTEVADYINDLPAHQFFFSVFEYPQNGFVEVTPLPNIELPSDTNWQRYSQKGFIKVVRQMEPSTTPVHDKLPTLEEFQLNPDDYDLSYEEYRKVANECARRVGSREI